MALMTMMVIITMIMTMMVVVIVIMTMIMLNRLHCIPVYDVIHLTGRTLPGNI